MNAPNPMTYSDYTPDLLFAKEQVFAQSKKIEMDTLTRIRQLRAQSADLQTVWHKIAVWIVAPVLASYARWIINHTPGQFLGVMREGRFLARLVEKMGHQPLQEVWLNRDLSLRAAFGCGDDNALINWLTRTRLQPITKAEAYKVLLHTSYKDIDATTLINLTVAEELIKQWKQNGLLDQARQQSAFLAERLLRHWRSVTLNEKDALFLLDFASAGNIQRSLQTILASNNSSTNITGLNFAMTAGSHWAEKAGCKMHGFLSKLGQPAWFAEAIGRTPELMEIFASSPDGPLKDYTDNGTPILGTHFLSGPQINLIQDLQKLIIDTATMYDRAMGDQLTSDVSRCLWGRFLLQPVAAEAFTLADWPMDAGIDGCKQRILAAPLEGNPEEWTKMQSAWPAASLLVSKQNLV